jgi:hypothetical protein
MSRPFRARRIADRIGRTWAIRPLFAWRRGDEAHEAPLGGGGFRLPCVAAAPRRQPEARCTKANPFDKDGQALVTPAVVTADEFESAVNALEAMAEPQIRLATEGELPACTTPP